MFLFAGLWNRKLSCRRRWKTSEATLLQVPADVLRKPNTILSRQRPTNLCRKFCFATSLSVRARLKTELARFQMALHLVEVEQLGAALVVAGQGKEAHQSVQGKVWGVHHGLLGFV